MVKAVNKGKWGLKFWMVVILTVVLLAGCNDAKQAEQPVDGQNTSDPVIQISGSGVERTRQIQLSEMKQWNNAQFEHIYSTINNWPSPKKYAARGIEIKELLKAAGLKDDAKCFTFKSDDGFEWSFTREQLLETPRYYFSGVEAGNGENAEQVEPIIAYEYIEGSDDMKKTAPDELCLIIGQANVKEQTNITFVKNVKEIVVSSDDPGRWKMAVSFPAPGKIGAGETVKLQHAEMGKVKLYYTLDGTTPTEESTLYNPSTYQPELNKPIPIYKDTTIKVLVKGFGKADSNIATFTYEVD